MLKNSHCNYGEKQPKLSAQALRGQSLLREIQVGKAYVLMSARLASDYITQEN